MRESEKTNVVKVDDEKSIEELCDATWEPLYRFIYFKVQNREEAEDIIQEEIAIEDAIEDMAKRQVIENALKLLDEDQRTVIDLRILKGYSVADTAKLMNKKEDNIRVLQYRALQNIRKIFNKEY